MVTPVKGPSVRKTAETATAAFDQVSAGSSEAMRDTMDRAMAATAELTSFSKENMEAWAASTAAASKGMEALSARAVAYSKSALEAHTAATKALMTSKSVQEMVEKQTDYVRSAFDVYVSELNSMSDIVTGLAKEAMKPLNERVSAMSHIMQSSARVGR